MKPFGNCRKVIRLSIIKKKKKKEKKNDESKIINEWIKMIMEAIILMISWHYNIMKMRNNSILEDLEKQN